MQEGAASRARLDARSARLDRLAAGGDTAALVAEMAAIAGDPELAAAGRERLLWEGLVVLAGQRPHPAGYELLARLAAYRAEVWVRGGEVGLPTPHPLYAVAATARGVRRQWRRREAREEAARLLAAGSPRLLERLAPDAEPAATLARARLRGTLDALAAAPAGELEAFAPLLVSELAGVAGAGSPGLDAALAVVARRLGDPDLFALLFARGEAAVTVRAVPDVVAALEPQDALEVLAVAARRGGAAASAAVLAVGHLAADGPAPVAEAARCFLLAELAEPERGGSAAAALAAVGGPKVVAAGAARLAAPAGELEAARAVLLLQLEGSPLAREALHRFVGEGAGPEHLRREVEAWLGE